MRKEHEERGVGLSPIEEKRLEIAKEVYDLHTKGMSFAEMREIMNDRREGDELMKKAFKREFTFYNQDLQKLFERTRLFFEGDAE